MQEIDSFDIIDIDGNLEKSIEFLKKLKEDLKFKGYNKVMIVHDEGANKYKVWASV
jgi:GrpB-like predicted nucleotidyltransferase (UPF0157 family)